TVLAIKSDKQTADLISEVSKSGGKDAGQKKIADLYNSYMDEATIEKKGLTPVKGELAAIAAIKNKKELARYLGTTLRQDEDPLNNTNFHTDNLFGLWVAPDLNDPDHYGAYLLQGGIALPDRDYYISDSKQM